MDAIHHLRAKPKFGGLIPLIDAGVDAIVEGFRMKAVGLAVGGVALLLLLLLAYLVWRWWGHRWPHRLPPTRLEEEEVEMSTFPRSDVAIFAETP